LSERGARQLEIIQRAVDDVAQTLRAWASSIAARAAGLARAGGLNKLVPQVVDLTRARWSDMALQRGAAIDVRTELRTSAADRGGRKPDPRRAGESRVQRGGRDAEGGRSRIRTAARRAEGRPCCSK
jgi:hypothetical protein